MIQFSCQMISSCHGQSNIDKEQVVVHRIDHHRISRPDEAGRTERRLLDAAHFVDGTVVIEEVGDGEHPLPGGSPEHRGKRPCGMVQERLDLGGDRCFVEYLLKVRSGETEDAHDPEGGSDLTELDLWLLSCGFFQLLLILVASLELIQLSGFIKCMASYFKEEEENLQLKLIFRNKNEII